MAGCAARNGRSIGRPDAAVVSALPLSGIYGHAVFAARQISHPPVGVKYYKSLLFTIGRIRGKVIDRDLRPFCTSKFQFGREKRCECKCRQESGIKRKRRIEH